MGIKVSHNKYSLKNSKLEKFKSSGKYKNYLLTLDKKKYCLTITKSYSKNCLQLTRNEKLGTLISNSFLTLTGGILYYDFRNSFDNNKKIQSILFQKHNYGIFYYEEELKEVNKEYERIEKTRRDIIAIKYHVNLLISRLSELEENNEVYSI